MLRVDQPVAVEHADGGLVVVELVAREVRRIEPPADGQGTDDARGEQEEVSGPEASGQSRSTT